MLFQGLGPRVPAGARFSMWLMGCSPCTQHAEGMLCRGSQVPDMRVASAPRGEVGLGSLHVSPHG